MDEFFDKEVRTDLKKVREFVILCACTIPMLFCFSFIEKYFDIIYFNFCFDDNGKLRPREIGYSAKLTVLFSFLPIYCYFLFDLAFLIFKTTKQLKKNCLTFIKKFSIFRRFEEAVSMVEENIIDLIIIVIHLPMIIPLLLVLNIPFFIYQIIKILYLKVEALYFLRFPFQNLPELLQHRFLELQIPQNRLKLSKAIPQLKINQNYLYLDRLEIYPRPRIPWVGKSFRNFSSYLMS